MDMPENLKLALKSRLEYRETFLRTVKAAESRTSMESIKMLWQELETLLPALKSSANLAQPVSASFSAKLQRKLASTVPPRPIVDLKWETAFDHLERLCRDGAVAAEVLKYYDSHSLMVSTFPATVLLPNLFLDICYVLPSAKTTTFGLHPHITSTLYLWRHDNIRHNVRTTNSGRRLSEHGSTST
jgi:hypothetical protein